MDSFWKRISALALILLLAIIVSLSAYLATYDYKNNDTSPPTVDISSIGFRDQPLAPSDTGLLTIQKFTFKSGLFVLLQIGKRIILPLTFIASLSALLYFLPITIPPSVIVAIAVACVVGLIMYNINKGSFFVTSDSFMQNAVKALENRDEAFYYSFPIQNVSLRSLMELIIAFSTMYKLEINALPKEAACDVCTNRSIGTDLLQDNIKYLPLSYSPSPFEIAGKGKAEIDLSIDIPDSFSLSKAPFPSHMFVKQYGDDTIGVLKDGSLLIVADGVGGSILPEHARLASLCAILFTLQSFTETLKDASILDFGQSLLNCIAEFLKRTRCWGATTLTAAKIDHNGVMQVLHIGDSTCIVIRGDSIVFATMPGQSEFNCPHQLCFAEIGPFSAYEFQLVDGDVVLLYSDGVGDNLWPKDILTLRSAGRIAVKSAEIVQDGLTSDIPFSLSSGKAIFGKMDDISVLSYTFKVDKA